MRIKILSRLKMVMNQKFNRPSKNYRLKSFQSTQKLKGTNFQSLKQELFLNQKEINPINQKYDTILEENIFLQTELAELREVLQTQKPIVIRQKLTSIPKNNHSKKMKTY